MATDWIDYRTTLLKALHKRGVERDNQAAKIFLDCTAEAAESAADDLEVDPAIWIQNAQALMRAIAEEAGEPEFQI